MKLHHILFVILITISSSVVNAQVNWLTFEEAVSKAKTDPKPIFIDVYTDWCGWCKKMDKATFSEAKIAKMLQDDFYPVKFNAEQKESIEFNNHTFNAFVWYRAF